jgi:NitT/TauT family transport system substrate-binding protein
MIQVTEPIMTATIQKAAARIRSITAPETIEAAVQENSKNAAQNTPLIRAQKAVSSALRAAVKKGEIDALVNLDPVISKLQQDGDIYILADLRTEDGNMKLFGGNNPAAVAYAKADFIAKNPVTTQHLVNAFYKTLKWLETATPHDVAQVVPEQYYLGDKALYLAAVKNSKAMYSTTGVVSEQGMKNALNMLVQFDKELAAAKIDLAKTFEGQFVKKAAGGT